MKKNKYFFFWIITDDEEKLSFDFELLVQSALEETSGRGVVFYKWKKSFGRVLSNAF